MHKDADKYKTSEEHRAKMRAHYQANKEKYKAQSKQWKAQNKEKVYNPEIDRKQKLRTKYGLSWEQYEQMYNDQQGRCKICKNYAELWPEKRSHGLYVDHCHSTGKIRGLLCHYCNLGLGHFKDNPEFLLEAERYLRESD